MFPEKLLCVLKLFSIKDSKMDQSFRREKWNLAIEVIATGWVLRKAGSSWSL